MLSSDLPQFAFEIGVLRRDLGNFRANGSEIGIPVEHEDCDLGVPPVQIGKELVYRSEKDFSPFQNLHKAMETFFPSTRYEDVGLALEIESFAGRLPLENAIELHEEVGAQVFFSHIAPYFSRQGDCGAITGLA